MPEVFPPCSRFVIAWPPRVGCSEGQLPRLHIIYTMVEAKNAVVRREDNESATVFCRPGESWQELEIVIFPPYTHLNKEFLCRHAPFARQVTWSMRSRCQSFVAGGRNWKQLRSLFTIAVAIAITTTIAIAGGKVVPSTGKGLAVGSGKRGRHGGEQQGQGQAMKLNIQSRLFCAQQCLLGLAELWRRAHGRELPQLGPSRASAHQPAPVPPPHPRPLQLATDRGRDADCALLHQSGTRGSLSRCGCQLTAIRSLRRVWRVPTAPACSTRTRCMTDSGSCSFSPRDVFRVEGVDRAYG